MLLFYTSFLFGIVHIYGLCQAHWIGPAFFCMMVLSCSNYYMQYHERYKKVPFMYTVRKIDTVYAHLLTLGTAIQAVYTPWHPYLYMYWSCLAWMFSIYWITNQSNHTQHGDTWHATVHLAGTVGACSLVAASIHS